MTAREVILKNNHGTNEEWITFSEVEEVMQEYAKTKCQELIEKDFTVECNVCKQHYVNWTGSTPCCGSLAFLVDEDGNTSKKVSLFSSVGTVMLDFGEKN